MEVVIGKTKLQVETADSFWSQAKGLMFRDTLPEGMMFVFSAPRRLSFWMMFVKHPIDIVFIGEDKKVVKIHHAARPTLNPFGRVYCSGAKAKYALEVVAGFCKKNGIAEGADVRL
ncbi:MAG: DUF192 domain-containing protein [Candidatus Aenigmatarchaeota archaeon]